jgi:high affinity Mn2+ porin
VRRLAFVIVTIVLLAGRSWGKGSSVESVEDQKERLRREIEALPPTPEWYSLHFQSTVIEQYHPSFDARYSGANSFTTDQQAATALTSTVFGDLKLWRDAELVFNPEAAGGLGLSSTVGIAAFPNGEVYRVGDPAPVVYIARLYLKQTIGLGGGKVRVDAGPNQLAGWVDRRRLTLQLGRFSLSDLFDGNAFAHDAHTQFTTWAIWESGAWDYAADTRGYTYSLAGELTWDWFSVRAAIALLPLYANYREFQWDISKELSYQAEGEARWRWRGRRGAARLLAFVNNMRGGNYNEVLMNPIYHMSITADRKYGRLKSGFAFSADQVIIAGILGVFVRVSFNDGQNESWAFTEIDQSFATGMTLGGSPWKRSNDEAGVGFALSGLSDPHRRYLAAGGYGFLLGDGKLNYAPELVGEIYYKAQATGWLSFIASYQPVVNPGYNQDRGPVHIIGARAHVAF